MYIGSLFYLELYNAIINMWKMLIKLFLVFLLVLNRFCNATTSVPAVEFLQEKDCDSILEISINPNTENSIISEFTACGTYSFKFLKPVKPFVLKGSTWSTYLLMNNFEKKYGFVSLGGALYIFKWTNQNLKPDQWQHICYTVTSKKLHVVLNGEVVVNQTLECPNCNLLQPKLLLRGEGKIAQVNLWSHSLELQQVISWTTTCEHGFV